MTDIKLKYGTSVDLTITLASLPSNTNLLAGQESSEVDNSTDQHLDFHLAGKITQGTTPTADKEIRVYVVGLINDSTWPDVFDGTNSAETVTSANIRDAACKLAAVMATDSTSDRANYFGPVSVASLFGGVVPKKFSVFVTHNTAVNLNATGGNHVISVTPIDQQIV